MASPFTRRGFLRASLAATAGALVAAPAEADELPPPAGAAPDPAGPSPWSEAVQVRATVNGQPRELSVLPDESALDVVRARLGLTGAKQGCGHGACGACAIEVNGAPVAACLLPAAALDGAEVITVEAVGATSLHPVQRAFMAEDALQCGFCTPGFVVEAAAFHDRWRAERGAAEPSREEVAHALAGHLCRCGAYDAIYRAVQGACAGRFDAGDPVPARLDAREKVTGEALYTGDIALSEPILEGRVLRAWRAPARVVRVDVEKARGLPGVRAVHVLAPAGASLRYAGQEIVAVAAVDRRAAEAALRAVELSLEYGTPVVGLDAARRADAPRVYPDKGAAKAAPGASEGPVLGAKWAGNVRGPIAFHLFADPAAAVRRLEELAASGEGAIVEGTWRTQVQCHTSMEPHVALARWEAEDRLTVHLSTQACQLSAEDIAERWELPLAKVRVIAPHVGGAFGAKVGVDSTALIAITLAKLAGAPVRVSLDRAEELAIGGNRPAHEIELVIGMDAAGELAGLRVRSFADSGVAVGSTAAMLARIMYPNDNKELLDYDVVTNGPPSKPMRGPGGPQALWALEQAVDELALRRGEDPIALRRRIDPNPVRARLYDAVEALPLWRERAAAAAERGRYRLGVGLAAASWPYFVDPGTRISLESRGDGGVVASVACQDTGQGTRTLIVRAVAEGLGLPVEAVELRFGDSTLPHGPFSAGSRVTASVVPAAEDAVAQLRQDLLEVAEEQGARGAVATAAGAEHAGGLIPWAELLRRAGPLSVTGKRRRDEGGYFLPFRFADSVVGRALGVGLNLVQVEVDTRLGRVRPRRVWAGVGVGRVVAPTLAESQTRGGVLQGLSYALYEERHLDPRHGTLLTAGLEDYRFLGIADAPEIDVHWETSGFEHTRMGGVGLAELVTIGVAAAVGNAVRHATGWRPRDLPLRPDRVLEGLRA